MRIAAAVEYDGRTFCGFQSQPSGCGVQDALERAVSAIAGDAVRVTAAGRTDAGVHATSQIVHFDAPAERPVSAWVRGVNAHLPGTAAMLWAQPVDDDFHARFAAQRRRYSYLLLNRPERPGLNAGRVGWYHRPLDVSAMRESAEVLLGTHDFSAFRAAECQAKSPVKTLAQLDIVVASSLLRFDFVADAFLHHMIRNIVGALVYVGSARQPRSWVGAVLAGRDRARGAPTFAADGLYFAGADYDQRFALPATRRDVILAVV
jgi:tRNA pseudouridine38-40 synthase